MPERDPPPLPESKIVAKARARISAVWIVPAVAALVGAWVAATRILNQGPTISIVFRSAEGLEAGKTQIHYNGVPVGTLTTIALADDHKRVIAWAQMAPGTADLLAEDTRFWVVGPRISGANVTGLSTLISGAYIGMEIGKSPQRRREFVALDAPPVVTGETAGRFFKLKTRDLGSIDTGTPLFFRRLQVGQVASYVLDPDGQAITVRVFVQAPYDRYVNADTRFWQASGVDVSLTAGGIDIETQSLLSILVGGIAFETPATATARSAAETDALFPLFDNRSDALKMTAQDPQTYVLVFTESVRGLVDGAPVEFRGIPIGEVVGVSGQVDARTFTFTAPVTIRIDLQRFGVRVIEPEANPDSGAMRRQLIDSLVAHGVRAQLQTGNLLTGALFVAFDFFPEAPPETVDWTHDPVELPTVPGQLAALETRIASIVRKLDGVPFDAIGEDVQGLLAKLDRVPYERLGNDVQRAVEELGRTLVSARSALDHADQLVKPESVLSQEVAVALQEVARAARGLRVLVDYLERHPEALLRGKSGEGRP